MTQTYITQEIQFQFSVLLKPLKLINYVRAWLTIHLMLIINRVVLQKYPPGFHIFKSVL